MASVTKPIVLDETAKEATSALVGIASAIKELAGVKELERDSETGRYTNDSLAAYAARHRTGKRYVFKVPKGASRTVVAAGAAAGIGKLVPATASTPADDPWEREGGPWWHECCNGGCDEDGMPWVEALETLDYSFARRDNGRGNNCYEMSLVRWVKWDEESDPDYDVLTVCDTPQVDLAPEPGAVLPDGSLRPYMLAATYGLSVDSEGRPRSVSGAPLKVRTVSHDSLVSLCKTATTGYSGRSLFDDWWVKFNQITKTQDKSSQATWPGCSSYSWQYAPAAAETGVSRVVLSAANAAAVLVGSSVCVGSATVGTDRNTSSSYDACDMARVVSKEELDDGNVAVNLEVPSGATFATSTSGQVSSMPWWTGSTDGLVGDGQVAADSKHPCRVGGVETMLGAYEVMSGALLRSEGDGWHWCTFSSRDSKASTVPASAVVSTAVRPESSKYVTRWTMTEGGYLAPMGPSASSLTGLADMVYGDADSTSGIREILCLGALWDGGAAGFSYVVGWNWAGGANWSISSRLSATGLTGVRAA